MKIERILLLGLAVLAIAVGCSSHGTSSVMPVPNKPISAQKASAVFVMHWPSPTPAAGARHPLYLSPSTQSISVSVNRGLAQVSNRPTPPSGSTTITIDAPVGTDTFTFKTFDQFNAQGNVLSTSTITQQIVAGTANTLNATLNGVVAKIVLSLSVPTPPAGTPTSEPLNVAAFDADNNLIIGPGGYDRQISLSNSDGSGAAALSGTTVVGPGSPVITMTYNGHNLWSATFNATANSISSAQITPATFKPAIVIDEFALPGPVPSGGFGGAGIAVGSDNNLWVTEPSRGTLVRVTTSGVTTEFPVPSQTSSPGPFPELITAGPDSRLWFTERDAGNIGASTVGGVMTEFPLPTSSSAPLGITAGPDGNLWFTESAFSNPQVGSITTAGTPTEFPVPTPSPGAAQIITVGPDRQLWFTDSDGSVKAFPPLSPQTLSSFHVPTSTAGPIGIAAGSDGALWFTESQAGKVGRITTGGAFTEFGPLTANATPAFIALGPDGAMWFTEAGASAIGRITTSGDITEIPITLSSEPFGIVTAPDGNIWFTEVLGNKVGRLKF
jgi:virginiamycin B lyase